MSGEVVELGRRRITAVPPGVAPTLDEIRSWPAAIDVPRACLAIGISSSWGYQLIAQGEFPCRVLKIRNRTRVITASLVAQLEVGEPS